MNLQHLVYFCELVKNPYMPAVAEQQNISQSTLSYAISKLEDELCVPLFEKSGRSLVPSVYGKIFYQYALTAINNLKKGKDKIIDLRLGKSEKLKFGIGRLVDNAFTTGLITSFQDVSLKKDTPILDIKHGTSNELLALLEKNQLDLAIIPYDSSLSQTSKLKVTTLFTCPLVAVMPSNNPFSSAKLLDISALSSYPVIGFSKSSGIKEKIDSIWKDSKTEKIIHYVAEADDIDTVLDLVKVVNGVAIVPKRKLLENRWSNLVYKELPNKYTCKVYLVESNQTLPPNAINIIKSFVKKYSLKYVTSN